MQKSESTVSVELLESRFSSIPKEISDALDSQIASVIGNKFLINSLQKCKSEIQRSYELYYALPFYELKNRVRTPDITIVNIVQLIRTTRGKNSDEDYRLACLMIAQELSERIEHTEIAEYVTAILVAYENFLKQVWKYKLEVNNSNNDPYARMNIEEIWKEIKVESLISNKSASSDLKLYARKFSDDDDDEEFDSIEDDKTISEMSLVQAFKYMLPWNRNTKPPK